MLESFDAIEGAPNRQGHTLLTASEEGETPQFNEVVIHNTEAKNVELPSFSIDKAIEVVGFGTFHYKIISICGLFLAVDAMEIMLLSFLGPSLECDWEISGQEKALLTFLVFVGSFLGGYLWGTLADNFGRKPVIQIISFTAFVFGFASSFARTYSMVAACRGIVGFCMGGVNVVVTYCIEFLPTKQRGRYAIFIEIFWTFGTLFQVILAWVIFANASRRGSWRYLVGWSALPCLICFILMSFMPESPRYLAAKRRLFKAYSILHNASVQNKSHLPRQGTLDSDRAEQLKVEKSCRCVLHLCKVCGRMFTTKYTLTTILLCIIWFMNGFCYYGIVLLTTNLAEQRQPGFQMENLTSCLNVTLIPFQDFEDYIDIFVDTLSELPGVLLAMALITVFYRRVLISGFFIFGAIGMALIVVFGPTEFVDVISLFFARMFIMASFITTYVYTPEVYPTIFRTTAFGICVSISRIGGMIAPFVVIGLMESNQIRAISFILGISMFISGVSAACLPFETKGAVLQDN